MVKCFCTCNGYKVPALAVDAVVVQKNKILLIKRAQDPFRGFWALVGGFVECGETTEEAIVREVKEEVGLDIEILELLGVYSSPERDPRGHVVSICYIARGVGDIVVGEEIEKAKFFYLNEIKELPLAFDHAKIISDYEARKCSVKNVEV